MYTEYKFDQLHFWQRTLKHLGHINAKMNVKYLMLQCFYTFLKHLPVIPLQKQLFVSDIFFKM